MGAGCGSTKQNKNTDNMATVKQVIENSETWVLKRVTKGYDGMVNVHAERRYSRGSGGNFFQKWVTYEYANRVYRSVYGKPLDESALWNPF